MKHWVTLHKIVRYWLCVDDIELDLEEDTAPSAGIDGIVPGTEVTVAILQREKVLEAKLYEWDGLALVPSSSAKGCYERIGRVSGPGNALQRATKGRFRII